MDWNNFSWKSEDPRWVINKRADIIIINTSTASVYTAHVDTKECYNIWINKTAIDEKDFFHADDEWPAGWFWAFYPDHNKLWAMGKE